MTWEAAALWLGGVVATAGLGMLWFVLRSLTKLREDADTREQKLHEKVNAQAILLARVDGRVQELVQIRKDIGTELQVLGDHGNELETIRAQQLECKDDLVRKIESEMALSEKRFGDRMTDHAARLGRLESRMLNGKDTS